MLNQLVPLFCPWTGPQGRWRPVVSICVSLLSSSPHLSAVLVHGAITVSQLCVFGGCSFPASCLQPSVLLGHWLPQQLSGMCEAGGKRGESGLCCRVYLSALGPCQLTTSSPPQSLRWWLRASHLGFSVTLGGSGETLESTSHRGPSFAFPWGVRWLEPPQQNTRRNACPVSAPSQLADGPLSPDAHEGATLFLLTH